MALQAIDERITPLPVESLPLAQCIGRTLRKDVFAERDNPPFDRVCMDGIAVSATSGSGRRTFRTEGTQPAGAPAMTLQSAAGAIEVMTGAMMPRGTDCVIPLEEYDLADGVISLKEPVVIEPFRNVQRRGSDSQPGVPMLKVGTRLGAAEIAVAASAGLAHVTVSRQPSFVVVSTGDELVEPGLPIAEHQVRRSNAYALLAALREHGFHNVVDDHLLDNEEMLRARLAQHLAQSEVLILSGGVSKGKFDLVPKVLKELRVEEVFYRVSQRPGMPMWFGIGTQGQAVFGLPGNPVSSLICLIRYVVPAFSSAMGAPRVPPHPIALASSLHLGRSMTSFVPVCLQYDQLGYPTANHRMPNGSGDFLALAGTDGFVELPPRPDAFPEGFVAPLYRW
jgi:molybdopterin molybdotransferase